MVKNVQNLIIVLVFFVFMTSLVSGLVTFVQDQEADIKHAVRTNGGVSLSASCNITILEPNNDLLIDNQVMTNSGDYFNFTLNSSQTNSKGTYNYFVTCRDGTLNQTENFQFFVNPAGIEPTTQRTDTLSRTIWIFGFLGLLCFVSIFLLKPTPVKVTLFLLMIWFIIMAINFAFISLQDEVVNTRIENFFSFFLTLTFYANYFIFISIGILWVITTFISVIEAKKRKKIVKYGG